MQISRSNNFIYLFLSWFEDVHTLILLFYAFISSPQDYKCVTQKDLNYYMVIRIKSHKQLSSRGLLRQNINWTQKSTRYISEYKRRTKYDFQETNAREHNVVVKLNHQRTQLAYEARSLENIVWSWSSATKEHNLVAKPYHQKAQPDRRARPVEYTNSFSKVNYQGMVWKVWFESKKNAFSCRC